MSIDNKDTVKDAVRQGHKAVGTSAVQITVNETSFIKGVLLKAAAANTAPVYFGGYNVTADAAETSGGFPLAASDTLFLAIEDLSRLYAVSSAAGQDVAWIAV